MRGRVKSFLREVLIEVIILGIVFWLGFVSGKMYVKKFEFSLWNECKGLKNSYTHIKRIGDVYISWKGAIDKSDCELLWTEDFCVMSKFE